MFTAQAGAFIRIGYPGATIIMLATIAVLLVISVVLLVAGAFAGTFRPRARSAGIVLLVVSGCTVFVVISWVAILLSPGIVDAWKQADVKISPSMFQAGPGLIVTAITALAGLALVRWRRGAMK